MMKKNIIRIICLILFYNCSQNNGDKQVKQLQFDVIQDIECIPMEYSDLLGITMQILKQDSLLLINDFSGDTLIHVYNTINQKILRKLIPVGNGPGEMTSPLNIYLQNKELIIFNKQKATLYSMPTDSIIHGLKGLKKRFVISGEGLRLFPLCDSVFISSGFYKNRYALIDCSGKKIQEFGAYPEFWSEEKNIPVEARAMYHQNRFLKHPVNNRFVSFSNHVCEIFDYSCDVSSEPVLVKSLLFGRYTYRYSTGTYLAAEGNEGNERGIMEAGYSSKYIYLVCKSDKPIGDSFGSQIKVIDWEGNPIKQLNYPKIITCIEIDEKEGKGYVIVQDPDDMLMYFNLDE